MMKAGIVGVGFIGAVHLEQLRRWGNVEVVALAEESQAEEKSRQYFVPRV